MDRDYENIPIREKSDFASTTVTTSLYESNPLRDEDKQGDETECSLDITYGAENSRSGKIPDAFTFHKPKKSCCSGGNSRCNELSNKFTAPRINNVALSHHVITSSSSSKPLLGSNAENDCCEGCCAEKPSADNTSVTTSSCCMTTTTGCSSTKSCCAGKPPADTTCESISSCVTANGCCETTSTGCSSNKSCCAPCASTSSCVTANGCSSTKSCCSASSPSRRVLPISESRSTTKSSATDLTGNLTGRTDTDSLELTAVIVDTNSIQVCIECDPNNPDASPHAYVVTRVRIANLCCAMEESLVHRILDNHKGVKNVRVHTIGRYALIEHCPIDCCAPTAKLVALLNQSHLGANVQEASADAAEANQEYQHARSELLAQTAYVCIIGTLFFVGLGTQQFLAESATKSAVTMGVFIAGIALGLAPILRAAFIASIVRRTIDIHALIVLATVGALASAEYTDACLMVFLFCAAEVAEGAMLLYVRQAVQLVQGGSAPRFVYLAGDQRIAIEEVKVGDVLAIRAGDLVVVEGQVSKGDAVVDESALTGEAAPVKKKRGDTVSSGTLVQNGYIEVTAACTFAESSYNKLQQEVQDVQAGKSDTARLVDRLSLYWTPGILLAAILYALIGGGLTGRWIDYGKQALVLLVLACPCAVVVATPIPSMCAIAQAARHGVLIRGAVVVECLSRVNVVAVDKTGTLTTGRFEVQGRLSLDPHSDSSNILALAAALEEKSNHPLANAVMTAHCGCIGEMMERGDIDLPEVRKVSVLPGMGVGGWVMDEDKEDYVHVQVGNDRLLTTKSLALIPSAQIQAMTHFTTVHRGATVIYVVIDDVPSLALALADTVRPDASWFVSQLHGGSNKSGVNNNSKESNNNNSSSNKKDSTICSSSSSDGRIMDVVMLTGDDVIVAAEVCKAVGIASSNCHARLLPQHKQQWVENTQRRKQGVGRGQVKEVGLGQGRGRGRRVTMDGTDKLIHEDYTSMENNVNTNSTSSTSSSSSSAGDGSDHYEYTWYRRYLPCQQTRQHRVLMLGDGINDASALAAAEVGVAMGAGGAAMAARAADVVLLTNDLIKLPQTLTLCRFTTAVVLFNCSLALVVKIIGVALALAGSLSLYQAVLLDVGTLVAVVLIGTTPLGNRVYEGRYDVGKEMKQLMEEKTVDENAYGDIESPLHDSI